MCMEVQKIPNSQSNRDTKDGGLEGSELVFCGNTKITISYWTTINRRMLESPKKILCVQEQRRSGKKMAGGAQSVLKSNLTPRDLEEANKSLCTPGPRERSSDLHKRLGRPPCECASVSAQAWWAAPCHGDRGPRSSRPGRHGMWPKSSWRRSLLAPPQSRWVDTPQTGEKLKTKKLLHSCESSRPCKRLPNMEIQQRGREPDFGSQQDLITELPQDWGNRLLQGTERAFCAPGPRRRRTHCLQKWLSQTCLWVFGSL